MNQTPNAEGKGLIRKLLIRTLITQFAMFVLLFGPAGTFQFWQAWAFFGLNFCAALTFCVYFYRHDRQLLLRRMQTKEKSRAQKNIMLLVRFVSVLAYIAVGTDHRLGWTRANFGVVPGWLSALALACVGGGYVLFFRVLKSNRFAASVIQTEAEQTVSSSGPYRLVRHPMYLAGTINSLSTPMALGSLVATPWFALIVLLFVARLLHEEKLLRLELPGYADYCQRTRYRLVPFLW